MTEEQFRLALVMFSAAAFVMWTAALFMIAGTLGSILWALKDNCHHWQARSRLEMAERAKRGGA